MITIIRPGVMTAKVDKSSPATMPSAPTPASTTPKGLPVPVDLGCVRP
ncbi:MAG: hypothetical protein ACLPLP_01860 [Mycobacterium sp.]